MRRVSNEIIWAGVASIVCGVLIASLLGGTGTPWILVVVVVALGLLVTTIRRRRDERALRAHYEPARQDEPDSSGAPAPTTPRDRRPSRATTGSTATLPPSAGSVRRAGARSQSLGAKPPRDQNRPR